VLPPPRRRGRSLRAHPPSATDPTKYASTKSIPEQRLEVRGYIASEALDVVRCHAVIVPFAPTNRRFTFRSDGPLTQTARPGTLTPVQPGAIWRCRSQTRQARPSRPRTGGMLQLRCAITAEPRKLIRGFLTWQSKPVAIGGAGRCRPCRSDTAASRRLFLWISADASGRWINAGWDCVPTCGRARPVTNLALLLIVSSDGSRPLVGPDRT
jgi:hypothetical protein